MRENGSIRFDRTALGRDRGQCGIGTIHDVLHLRGRIIDRYRLNGWMTMKKLFALGENEWMRECPPDISQLRARHTDQRILDAAYRFRDDRQVMVEHQVIRLVK